MDSEIHYEGWLIKSPPTKRIWRARWRRRWFALKQGELPGQYLLEYYTDQTCRKLKGVIDLDQCEQVDAGLFMERKFQHVFNVKTPRRTYYLAADSDEAMRYWVNCICNVCGLQDLSTTTTAVAANHATTNNNGATTVNNVQSSHQQPSYFNVTHSTKLPISPIHPLVSPQQERTYQNHDFVQKVLSGSHLEKGNQENDPQQARHRFNTLQSTRIDRLGASSGHQQQHPPQSQFSTLPPGSTRKNSVPNEYHATPDYYNDLSPASSPGPITSTVASAKTMPPNRPVLEKLTLLDSAANQEASEPSPALSTASGPYIPISECFSGSPVLPGLRHFNTSASNYENNFAHLNSLSRRSRFDIPRGQLNIGQLNLTEGAPPPTPTGPGALSSARSSDSESVFTDDEMASSHSGSHAGSAQLRRAAAGGSIDRRLRPSDSSIENENIGWTAMQRFSKVPFEEVKCLNSGDPPPRPPKRDAPTVIGPLDSSSCVMEERYEIPRSHRIPQAAEERAEETTELRSANRSHFYSNAAPTSGNLEGQVFRYDFVENGGAANVALPPPVINRSLKPKMSPPQVPSKSCEKLEEATTTTTTAAFLSSTMGKASGSVGSRNGTLSRGGQGTTGTTTMNLATGTGSGIDGNRSKSRSSVFLAASRSEDKLQYLDLDHTSAGADQLMEVGRVERNPGSVSVHNIHLGGPVVPPSMVGGGSSVAASTVAAATLSGGGGAMLTTSNMMKHSMSEQNSLALGGSGSFSGVSVGSGGAASVAGSVASVGSSSGGGVGLGGAIASGSSGRGIVYKTVDFVKTQAFNRTRQDAEMNRAVNKDK